MPAGIKYDLAVVGATPEACNIATIYRLTGGFNLEDDKLVTGSYLPPLAPLAIDFATRKAKAVKNVKVVEAADANATAIKIKKDSLVYVNMYIGNGTKAAQVTAINKTNDSYDTLTVSLGAAVAVGDILFEVAGAATGAVKGVYTLTIGTNPTAADKLTINGIDYTFAAAAAENVIAVGATATATASNLQDVVEADNQDFVVKANGAKLVFTQKVAGTGVIPTVAVTQTSGGTIAATVAQTTAGTAGNVANTPLNVANFLNYARVKVETGATVTAIGQVFEIIESKLQVPVSSKDKTTLGARFMFV